MSTNSGGGSVGSGAHFPASAAVSNYHDIYVQQQPSGAGGHDELDSINSIAPVPPPPVSQPTVIVAGLQSSQARGGGGGGPPSSSSLYFPTAPPPVPYSELGEPSGNVGRRGEPPSYDEAVDVEAPPPSYDSLFGRVREARKSSRGVLDFLVNIVILVLGTLGCTIALGITIVIPVCMIVFGSIYLYDCPQGEYIPVYLLVGGGFGVLKQLLHLSTRVRSREEQELERLRQTPTQTLINCFMLGWFIIGSFWIYQIYEPNYDPALGKYCNKSLYLFTFWLITSVYMMLFVVTIVLCSVSIISLCFHRQT
ncbi:uncharacterized protein LOC120902477 [Anopheles arabiensis]|uniref:Uncharacterized protein n=2 Tax=gambiae species complex TaxID=44542 RepID=A0A8W7PVL1_ANOCL|nr:uncharacterized protein LOC5668066 [Anopheles gambiae]XP_040167176.1 uncharacterized protein LOC120902477 [Anopheles arabiensis]